MNLENVKGENQDFLKALTKPLTGRIIQLDKKVITKIAMGDSSVANKSLIKVLRKKNLIRHI